VIFYVIGIIEFLSYEEFNKGVKSYNGNFKVKSFSCWHHLLCMVFGQMSKRESVGDLAIVLQSPQSKWYHLGIGTTISKSNFSSANENRDWRIYAEYDCILMAKARQIRAGQNEFEVKVDGNVYAVGSTTIDLCLNIFWWAKFRKYSLPDPFCMNFNYQHDNIYTSIFIALPKNFWKHIKLIVGLQFHNAI
jgi:Domain of unknown function (DUF4372)